jgi:hypothetical protein
VLLASPSLIYSFCPPLLRIDLYISTTTLVFRRSTTLSLLGELSV